MILSATYAGYYDKPRQDLDKAGIVEYYGSVPEWYARNLRYISALWNRQTPHKTQVTNPQVTAIDEIIENFNYFLGQQNNRGINFDSCIPSETAWMRGNNIVPFIENIVGQIKNILTSAKFTVKSHNKETVSKRDQKAEMAIMKLRLNEVFAEVREVLGVDFDPLGPEAASQELETEDDVIDWITTKWRDIVEIIALKIVRQNQADNRYLQQYGKCFKDTVIGRYSGLHVFEYKGMLMREVIEPQFLIFDNTTTEELNYYDQEAGFIQWLTPEEIFARWEFTEDERTQIYNMSRSGANYPNFNLWNIGPSNQFYWWNFENATCAKIACVTGYWKSYYNPSGKTGIKERVQYVHGGTLIGNKFLKEFGDEKNIVRNPLDKSECALPIFRFVPAIHLGQNRSMVDRLRPLQDTIDELEYKIKQTYGRAKGKAYVLKGGRYQVDLQEVANDFNTIGITVVSPTGEVDDPLNNENMAEVLDFTLDPNIYRYYEAKMAYKNEMKEITSISAISLGQQATYIGSATQASQLQQSNLGQASLVQSFVDFVIQVEQYCLEKLKLLATFNKDTKKYLEKFLSEREMEYLDKIDEFTFNDLRVYTRIEDVIDEQGKQMIMAYAQAWSQDPAFPKKAILAMIDAKTYTELKREVNKILDKQELDAKRAAQMQAFMNQFNQQQQMNQQVEMQNNEIEGNLANTQLKETGKLVNTSLKSQTEQQPTQAA